MRDALWPRSLVTGLVFAVGSAGCVAVAQASGPPGSSSPPTAPIRLGWISQHRGTEWLRPQGRASASRVRFALPPVVEPATRGDDGEPPERPERLGLPGREGQIAALGVRVGHDIRDLATSPARMTGRQWRLLGGMLLAVGAARLVDDDVRRLVLRGDPGEVRLARAIRPLGKEGGVALLGLTWAIGAVGHKPGWSAVAQDSLEATVVAAGLVTPLLKVAVGRARPITGQGSDEFDPFTVNRQAFPSGEVTEAFAIASVLAAHSRHSWGDALAWGFASVIAWERMRLDAHWFSDTVAGAFVGVSIGRWVVRRNRPELEGGRHWTLAPEVEAGSYGVGATISF